MAENTTAGNPFPEGPPCAFTKTCPLSPRSFIRGIRGPEQVGPLSRPDQACGPYGASSAWIFLRHRPGAGLPTVEGADVVHEPQSVQVALYIASHHQACGRLFQLQVPFHLGEHGVVVWVSDDRTANPRAKLLEAMSGLVKTCENEKRRSTVRRSGFGSLSKTPEPGSNLLNIETGTILVPSPTMHRGAYLVGVAGGSGSGKTTLIRSLRDRLPTGTVCLVSQDDYYHPIERQVRDANGKVNFDLPGGIDLDLLATDLHTLASGEPIYRKEYTFNQPNMEPKWQEIKPAPVILVEGLFILHHAPVRDLFELKVYVEASEDVQLGRRLARDAAERGYGPDDVRYQWNNHVMPAYRDYLLPYRSQCDIHVINEERFDKALAVLCDHLLQKTGVRELAVVAG